MHSSGGLATYFEQKANMFELAYTLRGDGWPASLGAGASTLADRREPLEGLKARLCEAVGVAPEGLKLLLGDSLGKGTKELKDLSRTVHQASHCHVCSMRFSSCLFHVCFVMFVPCVLRHVCSTRVLTVGKFSLPNCRARRACTQLSHRIT